MSIVKDIPSACPAAQIPPAILEDSSRTNQSKSPLMEALWRSPDCIHQIGALNRYSKKFKNIPVNGVAEAVTKALALSNSGEDVYIALAEYKTPDSRTAANVSTACAFWGDIDCGDEKANADKGYKTEDDALTALREFCKRLGVPMPNFIVSSGGGLHIYWVLDTCISREKWQAYATKPKLKALTHALGFLVDDTRTADIASVLRIPGTLNHKYEPPRPVTLKQASGEFIEQYTFFDAIDRAHFLLCNVVLPKQPEITAFPCNPLEPKNVIIAKLETLLQHIDSNCGYEDWLHVLMAIYHTTGGGEDGLELADAWSSKGNAYKGIKEIRMKWSSFQSYEGKPITIATLVKMARENGLETPVSASLESAMTTEIVVFDSLAHEVVKKPFIAKNSLDKYSLKGKSEDIAKQTLTQMLILGELAILGQLTVFFAAPSTGKTLLTLWMLIEAIKKGLIDPSRIYYVNVDDTGNGLSEKLSLADEYGFHILAEGYEKFDASMLLHLINDLIEKDQARGVVIILDTLKKFTNLMDKNNASNFTKVARRFSTKGGTIIALAHTNKNLSQDGKAIPTGTSDIRDDFDCAYILSQVSSEAGCRVVQFENIKRRGNVALAAAYSYTIEQDVSYNEILLTIQSVSDMEIAPIKQAAAIKSDCEVISAVTSCINEGINTKMKLADDVSVRSNISKRSALKIIEKYTGNDPVLHRWMFKVCERGAKVFVLLDQPITK